MSKQNLPRDQFSFSFNTLIYVCIFHCAGSSLLQGHSSGCGEQTLLSSSSACASHCCGFSLWSTGSSVCGLQYLAQDLQVRSLSWDDPLEKSMATHSSILAQRIPWTEDSSRL